MRDTTARLSSIGGALLAIGIVLAVAIHLTEQIRGNAGPSSLAAVGIRTGEVPAVPDVGPIASLLDQRAASDQGRQRIIAHAVVSRADDQAEVELEVSRLAERLYRTNHGTCAITVFAYRSRHERAEVGDNAPWALVWSPDGLGWDGFSRDDFAKHFYQPSGQ